MTGDRTPPPRGLLFTDLDGTLLDHDTYLPSERAIRTVEALAMDGVVTVPVSSKTGAEIVHLSRSLRLAPVAVAEGGGVIVSPRGHEVVGPTRAELVRVLGALRTAGWRVLGMSAMSVEDVCRRTGLAPDAARRAMQRQASEPFVLESGDRDPDARELASIVAPWGAAITRGGRFWHLIGRGVDKGAGVAAVCRGYGLDDRRGTGAVGDAWNDLPMLEAVLVGVLLGSRVAAVDIPPGIGRLDDVGPAGFVRAVELIATRLGWSLGGE